jgi:hypothetical protein
MLGILSIGSGAVASTGQPGEEIQMALRKFLFQSAEGFHEEQAATDEIQLGKVTLSGLSGVAIDGGGARAENFGTPTAAGHLATKSYVDAAAQGLRDAKDDVRAVATSNITLANEQTVDGVALVADDRVLVTGQTDAEDNGIYVVVDGGAWTRSTDADSSLEVTSGMWCIVSEGTQYEDTVWLLATNNPITLDTTELTFIQLPSLRDLVAGAGLTKTGNTIDVGAGNGIAVDADLVRVLLSATPGLEFSSGQLQAKPDTARGLAKDASGLYIDLATDPGLQFSSGKLDAKLLSTGGIQKDSNGLSIKIDDSPDTLDVDADGLKVVGLPSLFKVNGTAVSANVTAPNLDTLTGDGNADALHDHEDVIMARQANGAIAKGDAVYYSENDGMSTGDASDDAKSRILGIADAAISDNATGKVKKSGVVTGVLTGATAGTRYFMGTTGQPVLIGALTAGQRTVQVGIAKNATDLEVQIMDFGKKAA